MENLDYIQELIDDGYIFLGKAGNSQNIKAMIVGEEEIRKLLKNGFKVSSLTDEEVTLFVKCEEEYELKPIDILEIFESLTPEEAFYRIEDITRHSDLFIPYLDLEEDDGEMLSLWSDDIFFDKDEHLTYFVVYDFLKNPQTIFNSNQKVIDFIDNILSERDKPIHLRNYKNFVLSTILCKGSYNEIISRNNDYAFHSFYIKSIEHLANSGDVDAMEMMGYNYYEGINGYEVDFHKSLYWLKKNFDITKNPGISRTIGYIYYYGRTNNRVIEPDNAFKYFAHSHFTGHYFEATYKLADCYLRGYGCIQSDEAAYNLVSSIYQQTRKHYLEEGMGKYADVALRLGSYHLKGIGCDKNPSDALSYLLEGRDSIKERILMFNDKTDYTVAFAISLRIEEAKRELGLKDRRTKQKGFVLENYSDYFGSVNFKVKETKDGLYKLKIKTPDGANIIGGDVSIFYKEKSPEIEFLLNLSEVDSKKFTTKKIDSIGFEDEMLIVCYKNQDEIEFYRLLEVIYIPKNIKNITKKITVVSGKFVNSDKIYEYISNSKIKVGDIVKVKTGKVIQEVEVLSTKELYEDELPLPIQLMGKIIE